MTKSYDLWVYVLMIFLGKFSLYFSEFYANFYEFISLH
jgi:hypothetical protein